MKILRWAAACLLFALLAGSAPAKADGVRYLDAVFENVTVTPALQYGEAVDNHGDTIPLLLDLYLPEGDIEDERPAIVLAHGGGFTGGSRHDASIVALAKAFARRGYVTASISYRTRPTGSPGSPTMQDLIVGSLAGELPEAMHDAQHDMQAAVRWMRAEAGTYGLAADRIIAGGISAGASMALEAAFNPEDPGDSGTPEESSEISAGLSISGATDPRRIEMGAPPVALFNGTHDTTAPYPTAVMACAATTVLLNVCHLETYVGAGHDLDPHREDIVAISAAFLCEHVLGGCA